MAEQEREYWLDNPRNVRSLVMLLGVVCVGLFAADFLYHKHGHFGFEQWHGFYAWYGFASYCAIVLTAKQLRKLLKRDENYYDEPTAEDLSSNAHE